jgi:hypothetical protein
MRPLTAERLRELLEYDPETGVFTRKTDIILRNGLCVARAGDIAGYVSQGYRLCSVDSRVYKTHRLAWLYVYGEWPHQNIDHINGDRTDNRIANLRDVSQLVNTQNQRKGYGVSGLIGAHKCAKGWQSAIRSEGRLINLGTYHTPEEAHAVYVEAKRRLHLGNTL